MTIPSPLQDTLEHYQTEVSFQSDDGDRTGAATGESSSQVLSEFLPWGENGCFVLATTGIVELEYAALQKSCGVFDATCRGTILLTGEDRLECINRLTTQQLASMNIGESLPTFITSRKGSIIADVLVHVLEDAIWIDVDVTVQQQVIDHILAYVVMEDITVSDITESMHWLWCFGETANEMQVEGAQVCTLPVGLFGMPGKAIATAPEHTHAVWDSLIAQGARPVGWHALNMSRIERSAPIFMVDFDTSNLPHETNMIASRVRFDKGCYLGQEIVARMESLGAPKRKLMKLQMKSDELPIAGSQIWESKEVTGTPIGVITSSAISPMAGGVPAVIAMLAKAFVGLGKTVYTYVGSELIEAEVIQLQYEQKSETT